MPGGIPMASHEVRWFFEGRAQDLPELERWFFGTKPLHTTGAPAPLRMGDLDDRADVYLVMPGRQDLGIKWREGKFEVKGRTALLGTHAFAGGHRGRVERWVKWSYPDPPDSLRALFAADARLPTISVRKARAQRKLRLDTLSGAAEEVAANQGVDRGLACELTNLDVSGRPYCSLAFEAFPDDAAMHEAFSRIVSAFLDELKGVELPVSRSLSYPAWLGRLGS